MYIEINSLQAIKAVLDGKDVYTIFKDDDGRVSVTPLATHTFRDLIDIKYRFIWDDESLEVSDDAESFLLTKQPLDLEKIPSKSDTPIPEPEDVPEISESALDGFHEVSIKKEAKKKPGPKTPPIDVGKIRALANAGWSQGAIASEMHISVATVSKYLKQAEGGSEDGTV